MEKGFTILFLNAGVEGRSNGEKVGLKKRVRGLFIFNVGMEKRQGESIPMLFEIITCEAWWPSSCAPHHHRNVVWFVMHLKRLRMTHKRANSCVEICSKNPATFSPVRPALC